MVAFEVETASIAVSYIQESFAMPTESTPFVASPGPEYELPQSDRCNLGSCDADRRNSHLSISDFHDCIDGSSTEDSQDPISSHDSSKLKRRLTILLKHIRVFTAMAPDAPTRDVIESPLFRFFYEINGKAASGKSVYRKRSNIEKQPSVDHESLLDAERCEQYWEEISTNLLNLEVLAEYVPHMRLFIGDTSVIRRANLLSLSMPDYLSFAFCCLFGIPICRNFQPCSHL